MARIHLFLGGLGGGGAQRQFLQLAVGAREQGHRVRLGVVQPGGRFWERAEATGCVEPLWPERARSKMITAWRFATAHRRLRRSVRGFEADVLYTALYPANFLGWLAVRDDGAPPLVWGLRASRLPPRWPRDLWIRLGAAVSESVDLVIANSHAGLRDHVHRGFRPRSVAVVANGIDTDRFRPDPDGRERIREAWGVAHDERLVGLVGRLDPMKGHEDFLAAAARVRLDRPDVRFVCVGDGPAGYRRRLEEKAEELGLGDGVHWAGEHRDMPAVYSALDLLVMASRHGEGFPNVVGEAMACGTPCVVTSVGDAPEVVGPLGEVVPPERPDRLARAIDDRLRTVSASGPVPERDAEAGGGEADRLRRRIAEEFPVDDFVDHTLELLERVMTEGNH